jgi:hypothetical protein
MPDNKSVNKYTIYLRTLGKNEVFLDTPVAMKYLW